MYVRDFFLFSSVLSKLKRIIEFIVIMEQYNETKLISRASAEQKQPKKTKN